MTDESSWKFQIEMQKEIFVQVQKLSDIQMKQIKFEEENPKNWCPGSVQHGDTGHPSDAAESKLPQVAIDTPRGNNFIRLQNSLLGAVIIFWNCL